MRLFSHWNMNQVILVSKGQEELPVVSIILSSRFLYSFGLAKYSCNPFLLLGIIFLLGELLCLKMQTESGFCSEMPRKKKGGGYYMSMTLVGWSFQNSVEQFPKSTLQMSPGNDLLSSCSLLYFIAVSVCLISHILPVSYRKAELRLWLLSSVYPQSCGSGDNERNSSLR